ncbi:MAG: hypothetical protein AB7N53_18730, partial [Candidatus Binatia bacterium]
MLLAGPAPEPPVLSLTGGTGVPGGTVLVTLALQGDLGEEATSADADISFPADVLQIAMPVTTGCEIAGRTAQSHAVGGTVVSPGLLRLSIYVQDTPMEFPPLGNGDLVICRFGIAAGAPLGTAPLEFKEALLFAGLDEIAVRAQGGFVTIAGQLATPTPTATAGGAASATSSATATSGAPGGTATATATEGVTATATLSVFGTATATSSGATATATGGVPGGTRTPTGTGATPTLTSGGQVGTATPTGTGASATATGSALGTPTVTGTLPTATATISGFGTPTVTGTLPTATATVSGFGTPTVTG